MVAQDGVKERICVNAGTENPSGPAPPAEVLKCVVQGQQLDMLKASAGAVVL